MNDLKFSTNWNNKLDCKAFTTLRLSNRFNESEEIKVYLKDKYLFNAVVEGKKSFYIGDINNYIAYLDTGYNAEECCQILEKMYKKKNVDWSKQKIYFYLIVRLKDK